MAYDQIKESIKAVIKENGNYEITGNVLQTVLLSMVDTLGPEYQFLGIATKSTVPVVAGLVAEERVVLVDIVNGRERVVRCVDL